MFAYPCAKYLRRTYGALTAPAARFRGLLMISGVALLGPVAMTACQPPSSCDQATLRYATSTNTLYVSGAVSCTPSDLDRLTSAPISPVSGSPGTWLLGANLRLEEGARLVVHGTSIGGDVDELRLLSNAFTTISVRADFGAIDIRSTKVTSWDDARSGPDIDLTNGRSYMHVRSSLDADGTTAHESRMDILDSDVGYLGSDAAEAYGLVWKVSGSSPGLYDKVNVGGDVQRNHIHNNFFGFYSYGAFGMNITDNQVDHNVKYGLDPHDDSDSLMILRNNVHDNGDHGIICSQRCDHLTISDNTSTANVGNGIMLHRRVTDTIVNNNQTLNNTDTGIAVFDSSLNTVSNNVVNGNLRGIRLSVGASDNSFIANQVRNNTQYGLYLYKGTDLPTAGDGHPRRNHFAYNTVTGNASNSVKSSDADDNDFVGNAFAANGSGLLFERGTGNVVSGSDLAGAQLATNGGAAPASTSVTRFGQAVFSVDSNGVARLFDTAGAIFNPEEAIGTAVTSTGSELVLNTANIGPSSLVNTRALWVTTSSGTAGVDPTLWETTGSLRKQWTTQAFAAGSSFTYRVGDLAPNTSYRVLRDGVVITTVTSDAGGIISFSAAPGSLSKVVYSVQP